MIAEPVNDAVDQYRHNLTEWLSRETKLLETQIEILGNMATIASEERSSQWVRIAGGINQLRQLPYQTETDLDHIRGMSRDLADHNPYAINILENGKSYIYGQGHTYRVKPRMGREPEVTEDLLTACRQELDLFQMEYPDLTAPMAVNRWWLRQLETWVRRERDGEVFRRMFETDGKLYVRFIEPEQITSPPSPQIPFGIEVVNSGSEDNPRYDYERPLRYWVRPLTGIYPLESGKLFPPEPIESREIQHIKANIDCTAPRGLPTLYAVDPNLRRAARILRNMSTVTEMQAAIAWVKKHLSATATTIQQHVTNLADITRTNNTTGKSRTYREYPPGAILETNAATEYEPWAVSIDVAKIVAALQAELRAIASRVQYPEFMISSDASNSNYSSTMVAEGPATKKFERMQWEMIGYDLEILYRALNVAARSNRLPPNILDLIELEAEPPSVKTRDVLQETQANLLLVEGGASGSARVMSRKTFASRHELDYDKERQLIEEEARATAALLAELQPQEPEEPEEPEEPPSSSEPGGAGGIQEAQRRVSKGKKEGGQFTSTGAGTDVEKMFGTIHVGLGLGTSPVSSVPPTPPRTKAPPSKPKTPPKPKTTSKPAPTKPQSVIPPTAKVSTHPPPTPSSPANTSPAQKPDSAMLSRRVEDAYAQLSGNKSNHRVRLADLKSALSDIPTASLNDHILKMEREQKITLFPLDHPLEIHDRDRSASIPNSAGQPRHIAYMEVRTGKSTPKPAPTQDFGNALHNAFDNLNLAQGNRNYIKLHDLRQALPEFDRDLFDAGLKRLWKEGDFSLEPSEGKALKLTPEERASGIEQYGTNYIYATRTGTKYRTSPSPSTTAQVTPPAKAPPPKDFGSDFHRAFETLDKSKGLRNFITLHALRQALPNYTSEQFNAGLRQLRLSQEVTLQPSEGSMTKLSPEQKAAGIDEAGTKYIYALRTEKGKSSLTRTSSSISSPASSSPTGSTTQSMSTDFGSAFRKAFDTLDMAGGKRNYLTIHSLRQALPQFSPEQFNAGIRELRRSGEFGAESSEGSMSRLTPEEKASGIDEAGQKLQYIRRRNP